MRLIVILSIVVAVSNASLQNSVGINPNDIQVLRYEVDNIGNGNYRYAYEQTDGTKQEQIGQVRNEGREEETIAVKGSYSWVSPDGVSYTVTYAADENGYQPQISTNNKPVIDYSLLLNTTYKGIPSNLALASVLG